MCFYSFPMKIQHYTFSWILITWKRAKLPKFSPNKLDKVVEPWSWSHQCTPKVFSKRHRFVLSTTTFNCSHKQPRRHPLMHKDPLGFASLILSTSDSNQCLIFLHVYRFHNPHHLFSPLDLHLRHVITPQIISSPSL